MSTRTGEFLQSTAFHVPVDRFEIVNGPRANWLAMMERLARSTVCNPVYAHCVFTLKTAASATPFKRGLSLATIFAVEESAFSFTALFSGLIVSGVYDMWDRTGWFSSD